MPTVRINRVLARLALGLALVPPLAAEGDVQVRLDAAGTLVVEGDDLPNEVLVGRTGSNGEFVVRALGTTTVNGTSEVVLVADSVRVTLRRGNDRVRIDGNIPGHVLVDGGPGDDQLDLGDPAIQGSAVLIGGAGNDRFGIEGTLVRQDLIVRAGHGDDVVDLFFADVLGALRIETSAGDDVVALREIAVGGPVRVLTGHGADQVHASDSRLGDAAVFAAGAGDDLVELGVGLSIEGDLLVRLGDGADALEIAGTDVAGGTALHGGRGADVYVDGGGNLFLGTFAVDGF